MILVLSFNVTSVYNKLENNTIPYVDGLVDVQDMSWFGVQHSPETVDKHTQELNDQRTNYIEGVTEEGLIGNLEAISTN